MSSSPSSSSSKIGKYSVHSLNSEIEYPHKQPKTETEYLEFFESLFHTDLNQVDQQELKAFCLVIETPPQAIKPQFKSDPRLFNFIHCIISRADVTFQELLLAYNPPDSPSFISLIPILLWVFVSQKSKRFVEPFLVQYYEQTRVKSNEFCAQVLNGFEIPRLAHKPISNEEKNSVLLCYLVDYLQNFSLVSKQSISTFLAFSQNLVNGIENPEPNIDNISETLSPLALTLQYSLTENLTTVILLIITQIHSHKKQKKKALTFILNYCQKEVIPQGIILSKYLLTS